MVTFLLLLYSFTSSRTQNMRYKMVNKIKIVVVAHFPRPLWSSCSLNGRILYVDY